MNKDLVSVIMPAYNVEDYIAESIQSVQAQTYPHWELIIVDDCSTDRTYERARSFLGDSRIHLYKNILNRGAANSRIYALREAVGRWIAFLDAKDVWLPRKLERQLAFMIEHNYQFTFTDYRIRLNGEWLPYIYTGPAVVTKRKLYLSCWFWTCTLIYDRKQVGLVQIPDQRKDNDEALWFAIIKKANCYRFPHCLSYYYRHEDSDESRWRLIQNKYFLFRSGLNKSRPVSVMLACSNLFFSFLGEMIYRKKAAARP